MTIPRRILGAIALSALAGLVACEEGAPILAGGGSGGAGAAMPGAAEGERLFFRPLSSRRTR